MEKANMNGTINLPNQTLCWDQIKKSNKLLRIVFQFDVYTTKEGDKAFSLAAYPVYGKKKGWKFGKRIPLTNSKDGGSTDLPLPLTLGNLELNSDQVRILKKRDAKELYFSAYLYTKNDHAAYTVADDSGLENLQANPCPPAKPADV